MKQALLIVDVQNYFINKNTQAIPGRIKHLIENGHFPLIVFSQFINTPSSPFIKMQIFTGCLRSPYIDIAAELRPWIKKGNVFAKNTYSVFANPDFVNYLKKNEIEELIICGLDTDFCVLADCFNAFDQGYKVTVVADCCASFTSGQAGHQKALEIIQNNLGNVI